MIEVLLSQFGMGMQDGKVLRWLVAEGEAVSAGQPLCEVEAAKAVVVIESPAAGVLAQIKVPAEETALVRDVLAVIEPHGDVEKTVGSSGPAASISAAPKDPGPTAATTADSLQIEPRARRRAAELGIDPAQLRGTGPRGRITAEDVERAAASQSPGRDYEDIPVTAIRRTIAKRLADAKQTVPHFYVKAHCRVDALLAMRARLNGELSGAKLSINDLMIKAAALALREVPEANVSWLDSVIRRHTRIDVAMAVATPTGLFTPVLRNADLKSLRDVAAESAALAEAARRGTLAPAEYEGGSFTVSNLGMYGVEEFTAIINPPQSAILAVGAARQQPIVLDGRVTPAAVLTCSLSVDHRAIDGAVAGRLMMAFKAIVEECRFG